MKKIVYLIATALVLMAVSCKKEQTPLYQEPEKLTLVSYELEYFPEASEGKVVVNTTDALTATSNRDWCVASVAGNTVNIRVTDNASKQNRYARLALKAGDASLDVTVIQYGEVLAGLGTLSDITSPVEGNVITIPVKLNVSVTFDTDADWIHPELEENQIVVKVDPNPNPETRLATVNYQAGSSVGSFDVTQYPELIKPESWVITEGTPTYVYPKFSTTASLSAGVEDMYVIRLISKSTVEGDIDDWIFDTFAVGVRNEILAKVEAAPETAFKDYLTTGTDAVTFDDIKPGDFYVVALGFGENSYVSGRYQYKAVTVDDIRPAYYKWVGTWTIKGNQNPFGTLTFTGEEQWVISIDENNLDKELFVRGINSITNPTVVAADGDAMKLTYNASDGSISLLSQKGPGFDYSTYGVSYMHPQGMYSKNGSSTTRVSAIGALIFTASFAQDGSVTITPGTRTSSGVTYNYFGFRMYLDAGNGSTYTLGSAYQSGVIPLPFEMTLAN